jgi:hypothetical protein
MDKKILCLDIDVLPDGRVMQGQVVRHQHLHKGYPTVKIGGVTLKVHRLVAEWYVPNPQKLPFVNHIDGNKQNNHYTNLEWCTQRQNVHHALRTGLHPNPETPIVGIKDNGDEFWFVSQAEAARCTSALQPNINKCLAGLRKTAGGMSWRYYDSK